MLVKLLLTVTQASTIMFVIFLLMCIWFIEDLDDDYFDMWFYLCKLCITSSIVFGVLSLSVYLVWGYV